MEDLIIDGQAFEFTVVTGEILSQNKFSETHVSGGGGGGAHGHTRSISISSQAITKQEFWIKTDDGKEKAIQLEGYDIPLREGQRISVISIWEKKMQEGYKAMLINHSSGDVTKLLTIQMLSHLKPAKTGIKALKIYLIILLPLALISLSGIMKDDEGIIIAGGCLAGIWTVPIFFPFIYEFAYKSQLKRKLGLINNYLDKLTKNLLAQEK